MATSKAEVGQHRAGKADMGQVRGRKGMAKGAQGQVIAERKVGRGG